MNSQCCVCTVDCLCVTDFYRGGENGSAATSVHGKRIASSGEVNGFNIITEYCQCEMDYEMRTKREG